MLFNLGFHNLREHQRQSNRRGAAAIFGLVLTAALVVLLGMVIDLGYVNVAQSELRRTSDAAALAGGWELFDSIVEGRDSYSLDTQVAGVADIFSALNSVAADSPRLSSVDGDVQIGYYDFATGQFDPLSQLSPNAVRVFVHRQHASNGEVPLFFGAVMGRSSQPMSISSTAALIHSISGFHIPGSSDEYLDLLPFALDLETWQDVLAGNTDDKFRWENGQLSRLAMAVTNVISIHKEPVPREIVGPSISVPVITAPMILHVKSSVVSQERIYCR